MEGWRKRREGGKAGVREGKEGGSEGEGRKRSVHPYCPTPRACGRSRVRGVRFSCDRDVILLKIKKMSYRQT